MIFKQTWVSTADNTNVRWLQIFQLYKGFRRRVSKPGFFVKGTARVVEPPRIEYKGFKFKFNRKGDICRGLLVRSAFRDSREDGSLVFLKKNEVILLRKRQDLKSIYLYGPICYTVRRRRFTGLFPFVL